MKYPIRVLHVVGRMDRGGIETLIMNIYRNIDRNKVQFDFLCHYGKEAEYNEEIRALGGNIFEMTPIKSEEKVYYSKISNYIADLKKFFQEHDYSIVHGHMTNTASIYMPIAKKNGTKTLIAHSHLSKSKKGFLGLITDFLQIPIGVIATDYFACSQNAARWLFSKNTIKNNNVKILKNAVDTNKFKYSNEIRATLRKKYKLEKDLVIGHVGRFYHEKNHSFLIDVFNLFQKENENAKLLLVGEGPLKQTIENKVKKLGLENKVLFMGSRSDVESILQAIDVFVMPSLFEGFPVVTVEAQASGLPCVFSTEITKETNLTKRVSYVSLNDSLESWTLKIKQAFENNKRIDTSNQIIDQGFDIVENTRWLQKFYLNKVKVENDN